MRRRNLGHDAIFGFISRRISDAESFRRANLIRDAHSDCRSGGRRNAGAYQQESREAGARCVGERGGRIEGSSERIGRCSARVEASGERGESDPRKWSVQRRRQPREQSGGDSGRHPRERNWQSRNAGIKSGTDGRCKRRVGSTRHSEAELAGAGRAGCDGRIQSLESSETNSERRCDGQAGRSQKSVG